MLGTLCSVGRRLTVATVAGARLAEGGEQLHAALREIAADDGGRLNARRLGKWVERQEGRIADGLRFVREGKRQGVVVWRVESYAKVTPDEF